MMASYRLIGDNYTIPLIAARRKHLQLQRPTYAKFVVQARHEVQYRRSGLPLTRVVTMITASRSRTANIAQHEEIKPLDLLARPRRFAQKFEARCDAWIVAETAHRNALSQLGPSEMFDQCLEDRFKRQPMQRIAALGRRRGSRCGSVHRLILSSNAESTLLRIEGIQRR